MNVTAGAEVGCQVAPHPSIGRCRRAASIVVAVLCIAYLAVFASEANAQCAAQDVPRNELSIKKTSSDAPAVLIGSASALPAWKTITIGTFADSFALRNALDAANCGIGESAEEILARPNFFVSTTKADAELVVVSAAELGFQTDTASLARIYARAQQLGFRLAPAEVAPQLRLQYFDQPIGESLIIGMEPIKTWEGEPIVLSVANGGAGLILIGQNGSADAEIPVMCRFLFIRSKEVARAKTAQAPSASIQ